MTAEDLWRENLDLAMACVDHPFVQGIASGALPPQRFARYMEQDAYFLDAFARAYALALAKSPDREGFFVLKDLMDGVLEELKLHQEIAERQNLSLEPQPDPATLAYTDFLMGVAGISPIGEIIAAVTPCMRLYAWLGQELAQQLVQTSPYRDWVITYSGGEFESLARRIEDLLDRYAVRTERVRYNYRRAMELELRFFDSAWRT